MYVKQSSFSAHFLTIGGMTFRQHKRDLGAKKRTASGVQSSLDSYFDSNNHSNSTSKQRVSSSSSPSFVDPKRYISTVRHILSSKSASAFGTCPICNNANVPIHRLALHASQCIGKVQQQELPRQNIQSGKSNNTTNEEGQQTFQQQPYKAKTKVAIAGKAVTPSSRSDSLHVDPTIEAEKCESATATTNAPFPFLSFTEPICGLYLFENFFTEHEEEQILLQLGNHNNIDQCHTNHNVYADTLNTDNNSWKAATFNGKHYGQRWGVHCNLRTRQVLPGERPFPKFYFDYILPKLQRLRCSSNSSSKIATIIKGYVPNEMNAIDYHKSLGHSLAAHVDDRHLSKEVIMNMSLAGDCYMTFTPIVKPRASSASLLSSKQNAAIRVLLKRRCLQILTGSARYQYMHGIQSCDLLNERRISLTIRESPVTTQSTSAKKPVMTKTSSTSTTKVPDYAHKVTTQNRQPLVSPSIIVATKPSSVTSLSWIKPVIVELARYPSSPLVSNEKEIFNQVEIDVPPGLYVFPNFITEQQEKELLFQLDKTDNFPQWSIERHTGIHREKRWGVDHDLWSRQVREPRHTIPHWIESIVIQRLQLLRLQSQSEENGNNQIENDTERKFTTMMRSFRPNDVNAIEYKRDNGHCLGAHIDDRQKHTETIVNLSLAGNCYMEYTLDPTKTKSSRNVQRKDAKSTKTINPRNLVCSDDNQTEMKDIYRVYLPRRALQILTGRARYDYRHGIHNSDLTSERRISITVRETRP